MNFEEQKRVVLSKLEELNKEFDTFTRNVSPKHWRGTGSHFHNLRKLAEDIPSYTELTKEERNNPTIQKLLNER